MNKRAETLGGDLRVPKKQRKWKQNNTTTDVRSDNGNSSKTLWVFPKVEVESSLETRDEEEKCQKT